VSPDAGLFVPRALNVAVEYVDGPVVAGHGDRPAYIHDREQISFVELQELVNRVGNALSALGVEIEQRVAILLPNRPEFVTAFFGAIKIGAVPTPISFAVTADEQVFLLADSRARAIVTTARFGRRCGSGGRSFPSCARCSLLAAVRGLESATSPRWSRLHRLPSGQRPPPARTSPSGSIPRAVRGRRNGPCTGTATCCTASSCTPHPSLDSGPGTSSSAAARASMPTRWDSAPTSR
jgi:hypothetical protein